MSEKTTNEKPDIELDRQAALLAEITLREAKKTIATAMRQLRAAKKAHGKAMVQLAEHSKQT